MHHRHLRRVRRSLLTGLAVVCVVVAWAGAAGAPVATVAPQISGVPKAGTLLKTTTGTWSPAATSYTYQWSRCDVNGNSCVAIAGNDAKDDADYTATTADNGRRLRVTVTGKNSDGSGTSTSAATPIIGAPFATVAPRISGSPRAGVRLTATRGSWNPSGASYQYRWLRCDVNGDACVQIGTPDANDDLDFLLTSADNGHRLRLRVTATNPIGQTSSTSAATPVIGAPFATALPTVRGTPRAGAKLTASNGTWNPLATSYEYQWLRCDANGNFCGPIMTPDATDDADYSVVVADIGRRLRIRVTGINSIGEGVATSPATVRVGTPAPTAPPVISGIPEEDETLTTTPGSWNPAASGYTYQWLRCDTAGDNCVSIATTDGTDDDDYTNTAADVGHRIRVRVRAFNSSGSATQTSAPTAVIAPGNEPPDVTTSAGSSSYTEDGPPAIVDSALTVSDVDSPTLAGATVTVAAVSSGDVLTFDAVADPSTITGTYNSGTGVLTLSGTESLTEYRDALRSVTYSTSSNAPSTTPRTIQFQVDDGAAGNNLSNVASKSMNVAAANDVPVVTTSAGNTPYSEGAGATVIDGSVNVTDDDSANLVGATVVFSSPVAGDVLGFDESADPSTITGSYDSGAGALTLSGTNTVAEYRTALRSVTYRSTSDTPGTSRTLGFQVDDTAGAGGLSNIGTRDIAITEVNDAPTVTTTGGSTGFTEDASSGVAIDNGLTVDDVDDTNLASATVTISSGAQSGDTLLFDETADASPITDNLVGNVLTLTGPATESQWQTALRAVEFKTTNQNPSSSRTVSFQVDDGHAANNLSNVADKSLTVTAINDKPVVTTSGGSTAFSEATGTAVAIDDALTVADVDSLTLTGATVAITGGFQSSDALAFDESADASDITDSYNAATGVLTLSGTETLSEYEAALRTVTFDTTSVAPGTSRQISFQANDGAALNNLSDNAVKAIAITEVNSAPVVTPSIGSTPYTEDGADAVIDNALTVTDSDSTNLTAARIRITSGLQTGDDLQFSDTASIDGTYTPGTGVLDLVGSDTVANYETALRSIQFATSNDTPVGSKTIEFRVDDGQSVDNLSNTPTKEITVTATNDAPTVTAPSAPVAWTEDTAAVVLDSAITVADPDSLAIASATVVISSGLQPGDVLDATTGGFTENYVAGTGTLTLTGTGSPSQYAAALSSVTFVGGQNPGSGTRTVSFSVTDSDAAATVTPATQDVTTTPDNDAPTVDLDASAALAYTEGDGFVNLFGSDATVEDVDTAAMDSLVVSITDGFDSTFDSLQLNTAGFTVTPSGGGATITITKAGGATPAEFTTALRNAQFRNTDEDPDDRNDGTADDTLLSRTVEVVADDGPDTSTPQTRDVSITPVDDAPTDLGESQNATGNTRLEVELTSGQSTNPKRTSATGNVLDNATDVDDLESTLVVSPEDTTDPPNGTVTLNSDGSHHYTPDAGYTGPDSFQYRVEGSGGTESALSTVSITVANRIWYARANAPAGGDGRSETPFNTLDPADVAATATTDKIYAFRKTGDAGTLSDSAVDLLSGQQLLGSAVDLFDTQTLYSGSESLRPSLTGTSVKLDDGNTVRGLEISGSGSGAEAIEAGSGDSSGTLDRLIVSGSTGGIELANGAGGTWALSELALNTSGGDAISAVNAGTVNFTPTGTLSVVAGGGRGLNVTGTATSGTVDSTTVSSSPTQGINLDDNTGSLTLDDVNLTTSGTALVVDSSNNVTVNNSGDADITSTGGAVELTTATSNPGDMPDVALDQVSSSGGARGINIDDILNGTFSAQGGTLSGQTIAAFDVNGGSGTIDFNGAINNGEGMTAEITGRTGGTVSLDGPISESGDADATSEDGGIRVAGNTGGLTAITGSTKAFNTGEDNAVVMDTSDGHTLNLTGNNLDIDTTSGNGLVATASGTLHVGGTGNTILATGLTADNRALNVSDTDFAATDATFQSISSTGGVNGIRLRNTGTAGNLSITGTGANDSGGTIQNTSGNGIDLTATDNFIADEMNLQNTATDGVGGTNVTHFTFTDSTIHNAGQSDANTLDSAFGFNTQSSANENNIDGNVTITGNTITSPYGSGVAIFNHNGTITDLNLSNNNMTSGTIVAPGPGGADNDSAGDGIQIVTFGGSGFAANLTKATVSNNNITGFPDGSGIEFLGGSQGTTLGTMGTPGSPTDRVVISGNDLDGHSTANPMLTSFITFDVEGRARGHAVISNNGTALDQMTNVAGNPIAVGGAGGDLPAGQVELELHVTGNHLIPNETPLSANASGIGLGIDKDTIADASELSDFDVNAEIANNNVSLSDGTPIRVLHRDHFGHLNLKLTGNVAGPSASNGNGAIRVENGSSGDATYGATMCADIANNTTTASGPDGFGDVRPGITLLDRDTDPQYQFGIVGLSPSPATGPQTETFVGGNNPGSNFGTGFWLGKRVAADNGNNWHSCTLPGF